MQIKLLPILVAAVLSGCSLAPDYQKPDTPSTEGWQGVETTQVAETVLPEWRTFMPDKRLQSLIELALANNKDLKTTLLNVASLRAAYRIQDAERYPGLDAAGSGSRTRFSDAYTDAGKSYASQYTATVGVTSYELDLFGRVKNLSDQALERYLSQDEIRRSTVIALMSEVTTSYINLLTNQELLKLTADTVDAYQETLSLVQTRYDAGYSDALTLAQSKTALHSAQATLAQYKLAVAQEYNALRQLVGAPIMKYIDGRLPEEEGQMLSELKVGTPSELLLSRPDILAAEHTLKAANANVGAARAAFFPSIRLTGSAGTASNSLSGLFNSDSGYWQFAPSVSVPIFDWGSNQASLDVAKIQKQSSVVAYQKAIETAFKEVSDALLGQEFYMEEWKAQQKNLAANKEYYELARMRYEKGNDSYIDLLDAQRSLFSARESELSSHLNLLTSRVNLYKALGGGWRAADQETSTQVSTVIKTVE
ncbi:efflux transporter outer membrane subunit [Vibrio mangrovi]|uniref:Efflux transporter outer membrane subunit n=1 Tax=Vibrio mangrovi TaxID=474394 RepID=A0A1Y6IMD9_9VIBR|nr:efflux transporter outer membrane subunit [Vibrio mangrovi]MDW6004384.1 efflux transporter outer membrane subunit [Vibrio mangrovi]SMR98817.1 Outer membrane protein OprM precursor [Vibrio mangrovi]